MTDQKDLRIDEFEQRIAFLEEKLVAEIARIDKLLKEGDEGFAHYVRLNGDEQREISRMARLAFYKTHPEILQTLVDCDKIIGKTCDDGSDPQP
jgi:hypothetical protein